MSEMLIKKKHKIRVNEKEKILGIPAVVENMLRIDFSKDNYVKVFVDEESGRIIYELIK